MTIWIFAAVIMSALAILIAGFKLYISRLSPEDNEELRDYTGNMLFDLEELIGAQHGK